MKPERDLVVGHPACSVRAPQAGDCEAMAALATQLGYGCTAEEIKARLCQMDDCNQYAVYVAEFPGGEIAGWIGTCIFIAVELDRYAEVTGLVVDEQIRSRGIGRVLLGAAEEWARCQGCDSISVHSNVLRERAHLFYTNNGYRHVKTQKLLLKSL
jgi:GNAT superfamily N-acetyltransferase